MSRIVRSLLIAALVTLGMAAAVTPAAAGAASPRTVVPHQAPASGYWVAEANGAVFAFGAATSYGSAAGLHLTEPIVGIAATPDGKGYWLVASDGGIFTFGDARFHGSTGAIRLNKPIVGMASTPDGKGYWLVASDGGIFTFGDARFHGSAGAIRLNKPIVGMASTPDGKGYWLVASDGGIFTFGDARFHGSAGGVPSGSPIVGMAGVPGGQGYWLASAGGSIYSYGAARFHGAPASTLPSQVVGMAAALDGDGYWLATAGGTVAAFGDAGSFGSAPVTGQEDAVVGIAGAIAPPLERTAPGVSDAQGHAVPQVGDTLVASPGTWQGSATSFGYSWSSCDPACHPAGGDVDSPDYVVQPSDAGSHLELTVTATRYGASASARAPDTGVVIAPARPAASWNERLDEFLDEANTAVACTSASTCVAVGDGAAGPDMLLTSNVGASWTTGAPPAGVSALYGVACTSASDCVAVGDSGNPDSAVAPVAKAATTTDGGSTWTTYSLPAGIAQLAGVTCPSATQCFAVGETTAAGLAIVESGDGGSTWAVESPPAVSGAIESTMTSIACWSTSVCYATGLSLGGVGEAGILDVTTNGGANWTADSLPALVGPLLDIACTSATACVAVGEGEGSPFGNGIVVGTSDGGASWVDQPVPNGLEPVVELDAVSCPSTSVCFAGGENAGEAAAVISTTDESSGALWSLETMPQQAGGVGGVSCISATVCEDVGSYAMAPTPGVLVIGPGGGGNIAGTTDGSTWSEQTMPEGASAPGELDCPVPGTCLVTLQSSNDQGEVLISTNDGGSWAPVLESPDDLADIGCTSGDSCLVTATTSASAPVVMYTSDAGTDWHNSSLPASVVELGQVACQSAGSCEVLAETESGYELLQTSNTGASWTTAELPTSLGQPLTVSCHSLGDCAVAGVNLSLQGEFPTLSETAGYTTDGGRTWDVTTLNGGSTGQPANFPARMSCQSANLCELLNEEGGTYQTVDAGGSWRTQAVSVRFSGVGLSCPSTSACVAGGLGPGGHAAIEATSTSGLSWTPEAIPATTIEVGPVSCSSPSSCSALAVGTDGLEVLGTG
jgi:hypothetical protein